MMRRRCWPAKQAKAAAEPTAGRRSAMLPGCPGARMRQFDRSAEGRDPGGTGASALAAGPVALPDQAGAGKGPLFSTGAKLLIAADCTAYAYANVHQEFMRGQGDHHWLSQAGRGGLHGRSSPRSSRTTTSESVTVLRMEVPCCGGLEQAAVQGRPANQREVHPLAGRDRLGGRTEFWTNGENCAIIGGNRAN